MDTFSVKIAQTCSLNFGQFAGTNIQTFALTRHRDIATKLLHSLHVLQIYFKS